MERNSIHTGKFQTVHAENHGGAMFLPVRDSRKRKVRGMVKRNGKFYAQMRVALPDGKSRAIRIPLNATRLDEAIAEAELKRTEKRKGEIHLPSHRPQFADLAAEYLASGTFSHKKESTQQSETQALNRWITHLGGKRVDWITPALLADYQEKRLKRGTSPRTVNLDKKPSPPYPRPSGWLSPLLRNALFSAGSRSTYCSIRQPSPKNVDFLRYYLRFLAASDCREQEALKIPKSDVDMTREVVKVGVDGDTKNRQSREIQLNPALREVLTEILASLPPDTKWLFPSPQRGKKDIHTISLRESFYATRKAAGLSWVGFHDFRHYFASACVMAGIDYMTIAKWLGHQDGGILVGKTYGHLNDEHQRKAAAKLSL